MQDLGHHHVTGEARRLSGHSLFTGLYLLLGQSCPLPPQMYRQQVTCEQEGVAFASKVDMAVQAVEAFEPVPDTETEVLVDSWYFCQRLYRTARRRGFHLSGGLKRNRHLRVRLPDGRRQWARNQRRCQPEPEQRTIGAMIRGKINPLICGHPTPVLDTLTGSAGNMEINATNDILL